MAASSTRWAVRGADWRYPEFWIWWAALFAVCEWGFIYLELSQAHVANVGMALVVTATLSLASLRAPPQVRRRSALAFALVLAGGLVVLVMSWKYFGIEVRDWSSVKRAFWHDTRHVWEIRLGEGLLAFLGIWWQLATGASATLAAIAALSLFARTRSLGYTRSKQNIYGNAKWMRMRELRKLFPDKGQLVIGEAYRVDQGTVADIPFDKSDPSTWGQGGKARLLCMEVADEKTFDSSHALVFAGAGGFKTVSFVIPNCLRWPFGLVALDPADEVVRVVRRHREKALGKTVIALNPKNPSDGLNVLDWIAGSKNKEMDILKVAGWLMPEKPDVTDGSSQFFDSNARSLLGGLIAYVVLEELDEGGERSLREVRKILGTPNGAFSEKLKQIVERSRNTFIKEILGQFVGMTEVTLSAIVAHVADTTSWLSFRELAALVCNQNAKIKTTDILNGRIDVFINIDLDTMKEWPGVARLLIGALINPVLRAEGKMKNRLLFLLDEAHVLGTMRLLETVRDGLRKFGISLILVYQSVGQLVECYGRQSKTKWYGSLSFRSYARIIDPDTCQEISEVCGDMTVEVENRSRQWGFFGWGPIGKVTASISRAGRSFCPRRSRRRCARTSRS